MLLELLDLASGWDRPLVAVEGCDDGTWVSYQARQLLSKWVADGALRSEKIETDPQWYSATPDAVDEFRPGPRAIALALERLLRAAVRCHHLVLTAGFDANRILTRAASTGGLSALETITVLGTTGAEASVWSWIPPPQPPTASSSSSSDVRHGPMTGAPGPPSTGSFGSTQCLGGDGAVSAVELIAAACQQRLDTVRARWTGPRSDDTTFEAALSVLRHNRSLLSLESLDVSLTLAQLKQIVEALRENSVLLAFSFRDRGAPAAEVHGAALALDAMLGEVATWCCTTLAAEGRWTVTLPSHDAVWAALRRAFRGRPRFPAFEFIDRCPSYEEFSLPVWLADIATSTTREFRRELLNKRAKQWKKQSIKTSLGQPKDRGGTHGKRGDEAKRGRVAVDPAKRGRRSTVSRSAHEMRPFDPASSAGAIPLGSSTTKPYLGSSPSSRSGRRADPRAPVTETIIAAPKDADELSLSENDSDSDHDSDVPDARNAQSRRRTGGERKGFSIADWKERTAMRMLVNIGLWDAADVGVRPSRRAWSPTATPWRHDSGPEMIVQRYELYAQLDGILFRNRCRAMIQRRVLDHVAYRLFGSAHIAIPETLLALFAGFLFDAPNPARTDALDLPPLPTFAQFADGAVPGHSPAAAASFCADDLRAERRGPYREIDQHHATAAAEGGALFNAITASESHSQLHARTPPQSHPTTTAFDSEPEAARTRAKFDAVGASDMVIATSETSVACNLAVSNVGRSPGVPPRLLRQASSRLDSAGPASVADYEIGLHLAAAALHRARDAVDQQMRYIDAMTRLRAADVQAEKTAAVRRERVALESADLLRDRQLELADRMKLLDLAAQRRAAKRSADGVPDRQLELAERMKLLDLAARPRAAKRSADGNPKHPQHAVTAVSRRQRNIVCKSSTNDEDDDDARPLGGDGGETHPVDDDSDRDPQTVEADWGDVDDSIAGPDDGWEEVGAQAATDDLSSPPAAFPGIPSPKARSVAIAGDRKKNPPRRTPPSAAAGTDVNTGRDAQSEPVSPSDGRVDSDGRRRDCTTAVGVDSGAERRDCSLWTTAGERLRDLEDAAPALLGDQQMAVRILRILHDRGIEGEYQDHSESAALAVSAALGVRGQLGMPLSVSPAVVTVDPFDWPIARQELERHNVTAPLGQRVLVSRLISLRPVPLAPLPLARPAPSSDTKLPPLPNVARPRLETKDGRPNNAADTETPVRPPHVAGVGACTESKRPRPLDFADGRLDIDAISDPELRAEVALAREASLLGPSGIDTVMRLDYQRESTTSNRAQTDATAADSDAASSLALAASLAAESSDRVQLAPDWKDANPLGIGAYAGGAERAESPPGEVPTRHRAPRPHSKFATSRSRARGRKSRVNATRLHLQLQESARIALENPTPLSATGPTTFETRRAGMERSPAADSAEPLDDLNLALALSKSMLP